MVYELYLNKAVKTCVKEINIIPESSLMSLAFRSSPYSTPEATTVFSLVDFFFLS